MNQVAALSVIAGGAIIGAWMRYGLGLWLNGRSWVPWGTFAVNAIGGFLIGLAVAFFAARTDLSPLWRILVITGFLGALTTFSSFSAEVMNLLLGAEYLRALLLIALHLFTSLLLTAVGLYCYRSLAGA